MRLFLVLNILITAVAWIQQRNTVRNTFIMSTKERVKTSSSFGSGTSSLSYLLTHSLIPFNIQINFNLKKQVVPPTWLMMQFILSEKIKHQRS